MYPLTLEQRLRRILGLQYRSNSEEALYNLFEHYPSKKSSFEADTWTNLGAIRELAAMSLGSYFLINSLFKPVMPPQITFWLALSFATFTGTGSAYTHYELDRQHQNSEEHTKTSTRSAPKNLPLSYSQIMMLIVTAAGQASDFVGFPNEILDLKAAGLLNPLYLGLINTVLVIMGLTAAWAEVRACKIAMETNNGATHLAEKNPNVSADKWSLFSLIIKTMQVFLTSLLFWAKASDIFLGYAKTIPMKVSAMGLLCALPLTLLVTYSMLFYQYFINVNNQGHFHNPTLLLHDLENNKTIETEGHSSNLSDRSCLETFCAALKKAGIFQDDTPERYATRFEKLLLMGRLLGTATECSEELTFLLADVFSTQWVLPILMACLTLSLILSVSDARTAANNLKDYRKVNPSDNASLFFCCKKSTNNHSQGYSQVILQIN